MKRESWNTQTGFLVAAIGSAIGMGNIWRFGYMAYSNGGGAFLIPYLFALFTVGIPLLLLEFAMGHGRRGSAPLALARISRKWEPLGWFSVTMVMFILTLYYAVLIAWCLNFMVFSFNLAWGTDTDNFFFHQFLDLSDSPLDIGGLRPPIVISLGVVWILNWLVLRRGVRRGIEIANKFFMPLLLLLTAALLAKALTLEGAGVGVRAYLIPDFTRLANPKVWLSAYGQIFFSLGLSMGIMIAYSSYLPRQANLTKNALAAALANSGFSIFAGFAVFSVLGFMSVTQNKPLVDVVSQSIGLAFVAYPRALSLMPGGNIFGVIFFLSLVVAGLSSSISIIEAFVSSIIDKFGFTRETAVGSVCLIGLLGSTIFTSRAGLYWLDILDHNVSYYGLIGVGIGHCVLAAWMFRIGTFRKHINDISSPRIGRWWDWAIKYYAPIVLTVILISATIEEIRQGYGGYPRLALYLIGGLWMLGACILACIFWRRPWKTDALK